MSHASSRISWRPFFTIRILLSDFIRAPFRECRAAADITAEPEDHQQPSNIEDATSKKPSTTLGVISASPEEPCEHKGSDHIYKKQTNHMAHSSSLAMKKQSISLNFILHRQRSLFVLHQYFSKRAHLSSPNVPSGAFPAGRVT